MVRAKPAPDAAAELNAARRDRVRGFLTVRMLAAVVKARPHRFAAMPGRWHRLGRWLVPARMDDRSCMVPFEAEQAGSVRILASWRFSRYHGTVIAVMMAGLWPAGCHM